MYCIAYYCVHCIALHCITLRCIALCCITFEYITLHYIAEHRIALDNIVLHCRMECFAAWPSPRLHQGPIQMSPPSVWLPILQCNHIAFCRTLYIVSQAFDCPFKNAMQSLYATLHCIVHCIVSHCLFCNAMQFYSVYHIILHYTTLCIAMVYTRGQYRCPQLVLGCPNFNTMQSYIVNYFAFYCITLHHEKVRYRCPQLVFGCPNFNTIQSYIVNYNAFYHTLYCITLHCIAPRSALQ